MAERDKSKINTLRNQWVALSGLSAVFLFEMLDNSILNVALPTIGRELHTGTLGLQWITGVYAVVFGGLMLLFGAVADKYGRRRVMLSGLILLAVASFATLFVRTSNELVAVRSLIGVAAAMTTPGSLALAFRLFDDDLMRVKATTLISTVGLVGLAIGPTAGGFILAFAPWQALLLINVPVAILAFVAIRIGINKDRPEELHHDPIDVTGAVLGTAAIVLLLVAPTLFVNQGIGAWQPRIVTVLAALAAVLFFIRERTARFPLLDLRLLARPLVSSGLAYKAATGLATAGLGYLVTIQLQLDWHWSPAHASLGMLPQVVVLLLGGLYVAPFVKRVGLEKTAWISALAVIIGLAVYAVFGTLNYGWVAIALVLVAAGLRVNGVVAGTNVFKGLPRNRTSIGSALIDTSSEITSAIAIALSGSVIALLFSGSITQSHWSVLQTAQFHNAVTLAGLGLTLIASGLVCFGLYQSRGGTSRVNADSIAE